MPRNKSLADYLQHGWPRRGLQAWLLGPLALVFGMLVRLRRLAYRRGWRDSVAIPVPVVVIGNLIAGGAGKTPLTLWLAQRLCALGKTPGIVSRGYGRAGGGVAKVGAGETAASVGDEPLLLAQRAQCPVFVGADRAAAARALLAAHPDCDVILCDDGLQHYRLRRNVEIAVIDRRGLMNGWLLPAGPLREPASRLHTVDAVVCHETSAEACAMDNVFRMRLAGERFYRPGAPSEQVAPAALTGLRLHAVAGIGEPQRFFDHLIQLGLSFEPHAFPDHHSYESGDLNFTGDAILTTEKDALKCAGLAALPLWVLPVDAVIEPDLARFVLEKIDGCPSA